MTGRRALAVLAVLVLLGVLSVVPVPSSGSGCGPVNPTDLERGAGHWWTPLTGCRDGEVTGHDDEWRVETWGQLPSIDPGENQRRYPEVVTVAFDGDRRWVLSSKGGVYEVGNDWRPTGRSFRVPLRANERATDFAKGTDGRWWVTTTAGTLVYDPDARELRRILDRSPTDLLVEGQKVWMLFGRPNGGVVRSFRLPESWPDGDAPLKPTSRVQIAPETGSLVGFDRHDNQWRVVDGESAYVYTGDWQYTGRRYGPAASARVLWALIVFFPVMLVLTPIGPLLVWDDQLLGAFALTAVGSLVLAVGFKESLVPPPLTLLYRLPDPAMCVVLVVPAAIQVDACRRFGAHPASLLGLVLAHAPLLIVALDFLSVGV